MFSHFKASYYRVWSWMCNSGTIAWARFSVFGNVVLVVLMSNDIAGLSFFKNHPDTLIYWNIINGVITEMIRRKGTDVVTSNVYVSDVGPMQISKLVDTNTAPPPKG